MYRVLIIEDDSFKLDSLKILLTNSLNSFEIETSTNLYDATKTISKNKFDLILLDMSIPSHPFETGGGTPKSLPIGGLQIIFELKSLKRNDNCIIITQYPDIEICGNYYPIDDAQIYILKYYNYNVLKCIQYSEESSTWKVELKKALINYENFNS